MAPFPSAAWSSGWPARIGFVSHLFRLPAGWQWSSLPSGELALFSQAPLGERFLLTPFLPIAYCSGPRKANWLCFARSAWGRFPAFLRAPAADRNRRLAADLDPGCRPQGRRRENWLRFAFSAWASPRLPAFSVSPMTSGETKKRVDDVPPSCSAPRPAPVLFSCTNLVPAAGRTGALCLTRYSLFNCSFSSIVH